MHHLGVLTYRYAHLEAPLTQLQKLADEAQRNATLLVILFTYLLWRVGQRLWTDLSLWLRGRVRTRVDGPGAPDDIVHAQPLPRTVNAVVHQKTATVFQWNQTLHEDIYTGLQFTEQDVASRIRQLLSHFDRSETFGRGVHSRVQQLVKEETGLDTLPASSHMSDGSILVLEGLWRRIGQYLEEMVVKVEDDKTVLFNRLKDMKPRGREPQDILTYVSNVKSLTRVKPDLITDMQAIQIVLKKLDRQHQYLFRHHDPITLSFDTITNVLKQEFQYWAFVDTKGEPEKHQGTSGRPNRPSNKGGIPATPCPRCKKMGHWKVDCPLLKTRARPPVRVHEAVTTQGDIEDTEYPHLEEINVSGEIVDTVLASATLPMAQMRVQAYLPQLKTPELEMLLDSGAAVNIMPVSLVPDELKNKIDVSRKTTLSGFDGSTQRSEGVLYTKVRLGDCKTWMSFVVVKNTRMPLLGFPGLKTLQVVIDFAKSEATVGSRYFPSCRQTERVGGCVAARRPKRKVRQIISRDPTVVGCGCQRECAESGGSHRVHPLLTYALPPAKNMETIQAAVED